MKPTPSYVLVAALAVFASARPASAEESLVALGNVSNSGLLTISRNTLGAVVASSRSTDGDYQITVTKTGAFAGAVVEDFLVETSIESALSSDIASNGAATAVTNDVLTVRVRTSDLEDSTSLSAAVGVDEDFNFLIRRIPSGETKIDGDTRYLLAAGIVETQGVLLRSFGVDGITVTSVRNGSGDFDVTLTKAGAFVGDVPSQYLVFVSGFTNGSPIDELLRADVSSAAGDDSVVFTVRTDDVQEAVAGNSPIPKDNRILFSAYRLDAFEESGSPASRLDVALASVAADGALVRGASRIAGATVTSSRSAEGVYQVVVAAPGAFPGKFDNDFLTGVFVHTAGQVDQVVNANLDVTDANTLTIAIDTADLQEAGEATGVPSDRQFILAIKDLVPAFAADLAVGAKPAFTALRRFGLINTNARGQTLRLRLKRTLLRRFFFASENAGHAPDGVRLKVNGANGPVRAAFFRTTGPRTNISALARLGGVVAEDVRPGDRITFEGKIGFKRADRTPDRRVKLIGRSLVAPAAFDVNQVEVFAR